MQHIKLIAIAIIITFIPQFCLSQSKETIDLMKSLEGRYKQNENGDIYFQKIIEDSTKSKDKLYLLVKESVVNVYNNANFVTQIDNQENGLIVTKGIIEAGVGINGYDQYGPKGYSYKVHHILKCEIKAGKVRITLTHSTIDYEGSYKESKHITEYYPFTKRTQLFAKAFMNQDGKMFYKLILESENLIKTIETTIQNETKVDDNW